jgi:DNA-binding GntR family transcriptional regulator
LSLGPASRPERIAELLRAAIVGGRLKAADQVVESRLAKQMGVGQNAVREALHALEFEGFVRKVRNIGTFVTKLSRRDVDEIYRMRMELESLAVYWAREKERPNENDLTAIHKHLEDCAAAARNNDLTAYALADTEFHRCLWKMAGNSYLEKCLEAVAVPQLSVALFDRGGPRKLDLTALVQQHREWLEVIRAKPPRLAYIHTRNRIASFWGQVESAMTAAGPAGPIEPAQAPSPGTQPCPGTLPSPGTQRRGRQVRSDANTRAAGGALRPLRDGPEWIAPGMGESRLDQVRSR